MEKSQFESDAFGLNFFRSDDQFLLKDKDNQHAIINNNLVEVAKFSINSSKQELASKIHDNFKNVEFFNTILNYYEDTTVNERFSIQNDYELVDATPDDSAIIVKLITDIFQNNTVGYFKIPFLAEKISAKQELHAMQMFLLDLLDKPDKGIQFFKIKKENKIIGFTSYSIQNGIVYRAYAGIIESHRNINYYEQLIYSMVKYNYLNQLKAITFGVRADNIPIINKYNRLGGKITSIDYIYIASVK